MRYNAARLNKRKLYRFSLKSMKQSKKTFEPMLEIEVLSQRAEKASAYTYLEQGCGAHEIG